MLKINPQYFLDILQLEIRGFTISYSSKRKKDRIAQELTLTQEIELLEKKVAVSNNANFKNISQSLQNKKR